MRLTLFIGFLSLFTWGVPLARAAVFDPSFVLSDRDLITADSMTPEQVQNFLLQKGGGLARIVLADLDGTLKRAADIISRVASQFTLSPRFLLTMLQKEQSLVTTAAPTQAQLDWATGYAVCDACSKTQDGVARFQGFAKQVDSMAQQFRLGYLEDLSARGQTMTGIGPGLLVEIDTVPVRPQNQATSALYTYTPHLEGNRNFWRIWQDWFGAPLYPDGTVLQDKTTGLFWRITNGRRQFVPSRAILDSYGALPPCRSTRESCRPSTPSSRLPSQTIRW